MYKILIVDDDVAVTNYLMVFLMQTESYEPTIINDSREVLPILETEIFDTILLDMDMPNVSGFDILKQLKERGVATPVIILTGVGDVDLAVKSMKLGAFDYLTKPADDEHLLEVIDRSISHYRTHNSIESLPKNLSREDLVFGHAFEHLPTLDPSMIRIFHQAERMASGDLSIFIWGEIGTGKRSMAEAIHKASPRANNPFVAVNSLAQDPALFPANFFGQAKDWSGSREDSSGFLEGASGGTLFLDDIDCLAMPMQVRLRRVIQTGEFYREGSTKILSANVRLIVASNHDLTKEEYAETFSRDLLYHLMINSIMLPPLRDRQCDIPLIAEIFLAEENQKAGKDITGFSDEFMELLMNHKFPSNLRELRHIVATAVINEDGPIINLSSVSPYIRDMLLKIPAIKHDIFAPRKLKEVIREHVELTIEHFEEDRNKAADYLGISTDEMKKIIEE